MTSAYGLRFRGVLPEIHRGVDLAVPVGTPIRAMKAGRVRLAGVLGGFGNVVILDHGGRLETVYAHLSRIDVRAGEEVGHEQIIGLSGRSGNATGPHLHFEIRRRGNAEDPVPLLGRHPRPAAPSPNLDRRAWYKD